mmetsp:Transcript_17086/g.41930  ORF Transcript_17086/g.41930 Transcript_17086/m.41930 type:complete len:870 (-) Transcript_17086:173-2782(-)|eukprot:CAMPEP_0114494028 /NCGR_PEP_ID=MMETSP0109-20121206/4427_1 /TAXON_ID=29199 /ORGANISM="Chlorarachnion reptans, Strain CCCM449" /LENGTH=869 /DNA_ID=CAMNT_0001671025 /DNA_START=204 /DNA_END=2813 /DNA_ORIENTATION=+
MGIGLSFQNDTSSEFRVSICLGRLTIATKDLKPGERWKKVDGGLSASMRYDVRMEDLTSPPVFDGIRYAPKVYKRSVKAPSFRGTKDLRLSDLTLAASVDRIRLKTGTLKNSNNEPKNSSNDSSSQNQSKNLGRESNFSFGARSGIERTRSAVISEAALSLPEYLRPDKVLLTGASNVLETIISEEVTTRDNVLSTLGPRDLFSILLRHYKSKREKGRTTTNSTTEHPSEDESTPVSSTTDRSANGNDSGAGDDAKKSGEILRSGEVQSAEQYTALLYLYQRALVRRLRDHKNTFRSSVDFGAEPGAKNDVVEKPPRKPKSKPKSRAKDDDDVINLDDFLEDTKEDEKYVTWRNKLQKLKSKYDTMRVTKSVDTEGWDQGRSPSNLEDYTDSDPLVIDPRRLCAWLTDTKTYIMYSQRFFETIKKDVMNASDRSFFTLRRVRPVGKRIIKERTEVLDSLLGGIIRGFEAVARELLLLLTTQILSPFLPPPYLPSSQEVSLTLPGLSRVPPPPPSAEVLDALWKCKAPGERGYESKGGLEAKKGNTAATRIIETVAAPLERRIKWIGSSEDARKLADKLLRGVVQCYLLRALSHAFASRLSNKFNPLTSIKKFSLIKRIRERIRSCKGEDDTLEGMLLSEEEDRYNRAIINRNRSTADLLRQLEEKQSEKDSMSYHNNVAGSILAKRLQTHKGILLRATREDPVFVMCGSFGSGSLRQDLSLLTTIAQMIDTQDPWEIDAGFPGLLGGCYSSDQAREILQLMLPLCKCFTSESGDAEVLKRFERYARMWAEEREFKRIESNSELEKGTAGRTNVEKKPTTSPEDPSNSAPAIPLSIPTLQRSSTNFMLSPTSFKIGRPDNAFFADLSFNN